MILLEFSEANGDGSEEGAADGGEQPALAGSPDGVGIFVAGSIDQDRIVLRRASELRIQPLNVLLPK